MKAMRIRTDDQVLITSGKDKGKQGKVIRVDPKRRRVFVEGANIVKRHQRPRSMSDAQTGQAGIIEKEGPIDVSNVILVDPTDNKPTRVGVRVDDDGKRVRYSKRTDKAIDFFERRTLGRWPVIVASSAIASSITPEMRLASPTPMLTVTLRIRGADIGVE